MTGATVDAGAKVDVHPPSEPAYRDFTLFLADQDARIGQSSMPYPVDVEQPALLNYANARRSDAAGAFSGDPRTVVLTAHAGDPMRVHALGAPSNEQVHVFSLGGLSWPVEPRVENAEEVEARVLVPWGSIDAHVIGGAGGRNRTVGDFFVGDLRRPFTLGGIWGLQRVVPSTVCPVRRLDGTSCSSP